MNAESNESIQELLQILATAEKDVKDNRIAPVQETFDSIREALKKNNPKK